MDVNLNNKNINDDNIIESLYNTDLSNNIDYNNKVNLDLSNNHIGENGIIKLVEYFTSNPLFFNNIYSINLNNNPITDNGVVVFINFLNNNVTLEVLMIGANNISKIGAKVVLDYLKKNNNIVINFRGKKLNKYHNKIEKLSSFNKAISKSKKINPTTRDCKYIKKYNEKHSYKTNYIHEKELYIRTLTPIKIIIVEFKISYVNTIGYYDRLDIANILVQFENQYTFDVGNMHFLKNLIQIMWDTYQKEKYHGVLYSDAYEFENMTGIDNFNYTIVENTNANKKNVKILVDKNGLCTSK